MLRESNGQPQPVSAIDDSLPRWALELVRFLLEKSAAGELPESDCEMTVDVHDSVITRVNIVLRHPRKYLSSWVKRE